MRTTFALAILAFASSASALRLTADDDASSSVTVSAINPQSCGSSAATDLRNPADTSKVLQENWIDAVKRLGPSSHTSHANDDIKICSDNSMRNQDNQCLTWMG